MINPIFSIITICFNSDKTLERTIKSVLGQTCSDYEYIIVDGASTDNTLEIIKKYEPQFKGCFKWVSEPDKGIYDAMNKGIRLATGDIVGIVNSDDWLEPDALKTVKSYIETKQNPFDNLYCGWIDFHYENGRVQTMKTSHKKLVKWSSKYYEMAGIRHPAVFVPKKIYEKYGLFDIDLKIMADSDFILRCYFGGVPFCYIEKVISNMSDGGISNKNYLKSLNDYKLVLKKYNLSPFKRAYLIILSRFRNTIKLLIPSKSIYIFRNCFKS